MHCYWKPKVWLAMVLSVVLQPFVFLYLNRIKTFWWYLLLYCTVAAFDFLYHTAYITLLLLVFPIHAYLIAKNFQAVPPGAWYVKGWGASLLFSALLMSLFLFRCFLYEPFLFPSSWMQPTIAPGSRLIISKLGYGSYGTLGIQLVNKDIASPALMKAGQLYAFHVAEGSFVQRLVAMPGDKVAVLDDQLLINGEPLLTRLLTHNHDTRVYEQQLAGIRYQFQHLDHFPNHNMAEVTVPDNSYFFMNDNRDNVADSRYWGWVSSDHIIGKVSHVF